MEEAGARPAWEVFVEADAHGEVRRKGQEEQDFATRRGLEEGVDAYRQGVEGRWDLSCLVEEGTGLGLVATEVGVQQEYVALAAVEVASAEHCQVEVEEAERWAADHE